jgi:hypothetical protein
METLTLSKPKPYLEISLLDQLPNEIEELKQLEEKYRKLNLTYLVRSIKNKITALEVFKGAYKFISNEELLRFMAKYKLNITNLSNYTGNIPTKNLNEVAQFTDNYHNRFLKGIKEVKREYDEQKGFIYDFLRSKYILDWPIAELKNYRDWVEHYDKVLQNMNEFVSFSNRIFIVCDKAFISLEKQELEDYLVEEPDPIIVAKVCDFRSYFVKKASDVDNFDWVIVTAWGEEASDPLIVNNLMN